MQNRRIIDSLLRSAGGEPSPTLESNSMIVLFAHVRTGKWASIMPAKLAETLGPDRQRPLHPDRRAGGHARGRPRRAAPRADDAADRGAGDRGARAGEALGPDVVCVKTQAANSPRLASERAMAPKRPAEPAALIAFDQDS